MLKANLVSPSPMVKFSAVGKELVFKDQGRGVNPRMTAGKRYYGRR